MPIYLFSNPENDSDVVEVIMSVNDIHEYNKDGIKWNRVWQNPEMGIDTKLDPFSSKDFIRATSKSKDSIGSLFDRSKEMSIKRAEKLGHPDPLKQKHYAQYRKTRHGKSCPEERQEKLREISKTPIEIKIK